MTAPSTPADDTHEEDALGRVYDARLAVIGDPAAPQAAELLSRRGEHRAIARFSRAVGLPRPIPDLLGLSLRVPDAYGTGAHQDFLLVTSADYPLLHHIFLPALDVQQRPYSSSLPYRVGGASVLGVAVLLGGVLSPSSEATLRESIPSEATPVPMGV